MVNVVTAAVSFDGEFCRSVYDSGMDIFSQHWQIHSCAHEACSSQWGMVPDTQDFYDPSLVFLLPGFFIDLCGFP